MVARGISRKVRGISQRDGTVAGSPSVERVQSSPGVFPTSRRLASRLGLTPREPASGLFAARRRRRPALPAVASLAAALLGLAAAGAPAAAAARGANGAAGSRASAPVGGSAAVPAQRTGAAQSAHLPPPAAAEPQDQVFDVTLVPAGAVPRPAPAAAAAAAAAAAVAAVAPQAATERRAAATAAGGDGGGNGGNGGNGARLAGLALALAAGGAAAGALAWRRRRRLRGCGACGATAMRQLDAEAAFAELDMAERTEHLVGDVRYQVWRCAACGATEKRGRTADFPALAASAVAPPIGSAAFLRRAQSGMSILPRSPVAAIAPRPRPAAAILAAPPPPSTAARSAGAEPPPATPGGNPP
jgi:hypothetical protein